MSDFPYQRVLLLRWDSLLGKAVRSQLEAAPGVVATFISMDELNAGGEGLVTERVAQEKSELVINTYNRGGGIGMIDQQPGDVFMLNIHQSMELIPACHKAGAKKYVNILPNCIYPELAAIPLQESQVWCGYPEPIVAPYAMAKKISLVQAMAYRKQHEFNVINLVVTAQYGPMDHFYEGAQVIPSMITKFHGAVSHGDDELCLWESGLATREFIYADDAAQGILLASANYDEGELLNICTGEEVSIRDLAESIAGLLHFKGKVTRDRSQPEGANRKCLSPARMYRCLRFHPPTNLQMGLEKTVEGFLNRDPSEFAGKVEA